ncbi:hypothetical protein, partial [Escherichia coli]|uniref:hypothetical protein n=1 Tax=Escherichia coli TaxID=562 RepID=UPI00200F5390
MLNIGLKKKCMLGVGLVGISLSIYLFNKGEKAVAAPPEKSDYEFSIPNNSWMKTNEEQIPIVFLNRSQNAAEWDKLT